ncbi:MAG: fasciclin domain-containing protein [Chloroflexota bacterium]
MKRNLLVSLLLIILMISTVNAQDTVSIYDLASGTEELSTLVAALDASGLSETLQAQGSFTVFAPTNQAFENLLFTLDISADDLLASELLSDVLLYHVVMGEFFASDLVASDGQTLATALPDNVVAVSIGDDGTVMLNDVVEVTTPDVVASNGVVHLINDVLLPQSALDAFGLVPAINANVQVLHLAPDAPNVDVYMNGQVAISDLAYGTTSGYVTLPAGEYEVAVAPAGTSLDETVLGPFPLTLNEGSFLSVAAVGSVANSSLRATLFTQSFPILPETEVPVTVLHAIEGAPAVDILANDTVATTGLAYPGTQGTNDGVVNLSVPIPFDSLTVNISGTTTTVLDLSDATLESGTFSLIVAGGIPDAPEAFIFTTTASEFAALEEALFTEVTTDTMPMESIADIVTNQATASDAEFTILLQAIENADPSILATLQGSDDVTVFAPTDEAFENLLFSTGLTAEDLLSSPLLTDILLYHVVAGRVTANDVIAQNGNLISTVLDDGAIAVSVADDGTVLLNDVVAVTQTDIVASNGIIHVIDDVLLPASALRLLGLAGNSRLQIIHTSLDAPNVDVYFDGELAASDLAYGTTSGYLGFDAGQYEVVVAPAGTSAENAVLGPLTLTLNDGGFLSLGVVGSATNGTLRGTIFTQSFPILDDTQVALSVLHAIEGAPAVDVLVDGTVIEADLAYPGTRDNNDGISNISVPLALTSLTINATASETVIADLSAVDFQAGLYYLVIVGGTPDAPQPVVLTYDANAIGVFDN